MFLTCWPWQVPFSWCFRFIGPLASLNRTFKTQAHNNMSFYHKKEIKPSPLQSFQHEAAAHQNSLSSPNFLLLPAFLSVLLQVASCTSTPINTLCLTLLHRKTGKSSYWSGLEPLFPVFHTDSDYFWETAALQRGSAMLGSMAWWLLLDTLHDSGGFPGVLHSSDHYQVSLNRSQQACGESCQVCNQLNVLISTHSLQFHFHTCLIDTSVSIT